MEYPSSYSKALETINQMIPRRDIHGKGYAEVPSRVIAARQLFGEEARIETQVLHFEDSWCMVEARLYLGRQDEHPVAMGHATETKDGRINSTSMLENCETSAVGRCLGFMGIGSEKSIASAEEVDFAIAHQNAQNAQQQPQQVQPQQVATQPQTAPQTAAQEPVKGYQQAYQMVHDAVEKWSQVTGGDLQAAWNGIFKCEAYQSTLNETMAPTDRTVGYLLMKAGEFDV